MDISKEKEHIYSLMRNIVEERRILSDMYYGLKERLNKLNELELKGIGELDLKGYVDLHNRFNKEVAVTNIKRETEQIVKRIEEPKVENLIPVKVIEESKKNIRGNYTNIDKVIGITASVLKEKGIPMGISDMYKEVSDRIDERLTEANFRNNIIKKMLQRNPKVQRAMRGYYQYKA